jgi:hypothetical protein
MDNIDNPSPESQHAPGTVHQLQICDTELISSKTQWVKGARIYGGLAPVNRTGMLGEPLV